MPEQTHHKYSPSKAERIILCPGSVRLGDSFSQSETSSYAEEGILLHAHMAEAIDLWPDPYVPDMQEPEHRRLIFDCLEQVQVIINSMTHPHYILNDQQISMQDIDCEGTLDLAIYDQYSLHIVDYKFGGGIEVSPDTNPQLMAYADGALVEVKKEFPKWNGEVWLHIFQPRMDAYPAWQMFPEDLEHFKMKFDRAIRLAESKNPPIHPGVKQCKWCPAGGACKARHREMYANAVLAMEHVADQAPQEIMSIDHLAKILSTRKMVESAFSNIEQYLLEQLKQGQQVPGYKLTTGRSSRKWKDGVDAFILGESLGIDELDCLETKLRSPAQVEKLLKADGKKALVQFYDTWEGPLSISAETSKKESIAFGPAHIFREILDSDDAEDSKNSGFAKRILLD